MTKRKSTYKYIHNNGCIYLPKKMRDMADMSIGDIVRVDYDRGTLSARKVHIIEVGDKSPEAIMEYLTASYRSMDKGQREEMMSYLKSVDVVEHSGS